jgi:lipopolysaccharide/colanic/teichoic acid biosynthesis glycosyltransferase
LILAILMPFLVALALAIYLISGREPIVGDRRIGRYGRPFWMLKLRTMWPKDGHRPRRLGWIEYLEPQSPRWPLRSPKPSDDPRVTSSLAALCRRHSIDELPQLWHVIEGTMSYVGPRPLTSIELDEHYGPDAAEILAKRPGLSGLWQVLGRSRLTYAQRKRLDLRLVRNASPGLYFAILWRTVAAVIKGKSAW